MCQCLVRRVLGDNHCVLFASLSLMNGDGHSGDEKFQIMKINKFMKLSYLRHRVYPA